MVQTNTTNAKLFAILKVLRVSTVVYESKIYLYPIQVQ